MAKAADKKRIQKLDEEFSRLLALRTYNSEDPEDIKIGDKMIDVLFERDELIHLTYGGC